MKTPDLWLLIQSMEGKERNRFRKFLSSPYFNSDTKHIELFEAVLEQVSEEKYNREALDAILYPYEPYAYTRITNMISDLKKLVEQFLVQEELKKQKFYGELLFMSSIKEKGFSKLFFQSHERVEKSQREDALHREEDLLQRFLNQDLAYTFGRDVEDQVNPETISLKIKSLHLFYVCAMLKAVCQDLDYKANQQEENSRAHRVFVQYILSNEKLYSHDLLIRLYIRVLRTLLNPEDNSQFEHLVEDVKGAKNRLAREEYGALFRLLKNHALRELHASNLNIREPLLLLYQNLLTDEWPIKEKLFSSSDLKQMAFLLVELEKHASWEALIQMYEKYAEEDEQHQTLSFVKAYHAFQVEKNAPKTLNILEDKSLTGPFLQKDKLFLLTRVYYAGYKDEELKNVWRKFLTRMRKEKSFSAKERMAYEEAQKKVLKLLKLRTHMLTARPASFKKSHRKFQEEIENSSSSALNVWFREELGKLQIDK